MFTCDSSGLCLRRRDFQLTYYSIVLTKCSHFSARFNFYIDLAIGCVINVLVPVTDQLLPLYLISHCRSTIQFQIRSSIYDTLHISFHNHPICCCRNRSKCDWFLWFVSQSESNCNLHPYLQTCHTDILNIETSTKTNNIISAVKMAVLC